MAWLGHHWQSLVQTVSRMAAAPASTLANVLVVEPRYADPVSLVHYKKVLVTKGAVDQLKEMFA